MTLTVTGVGVVWVRPPPVAVTVMVWVPRAAFLPAETVIVDEPDPGAAMGFGLKVTCRLLPCPEALRVIAELKPPETAVVMVVEEPEPLLDAVMLEGEAEIVKAGFPPEEVTVSCTVVVWDVLLLVPVMVMV